MKRLFLAFLLIGLSCVARADINSADGGRLPTQGTEVGGKGADGLFHYLLINNDGSLNLAAGGANTITTATAANVSVTSTSSTALAANASRKDAVLVNYGATTGCFLRRGTPA